MAITILLCSTGVLPIYLGIALVMGENIGTTATANLAALGANTQARQAALAHLLFNVFGVIWVLIVFYPFVDLVCNLVGYDPKAGGQATLLPVVLATFHTCFNVTNTAILIGFIPQMERFVRWLLPEKTQTGEEEFQLKYIQANLMQTPEISVLQAQKETVFFARQVQEMFATVRSLLEQKDEEQFAKTFEKVIRQESYTDKVEYEIARYLELVGQDHLSDITKKKVRQMMREISELESIGDACYNLARMLQRRNESGKDFTPELYGHLNKMMQLADDSLTQMNQVMVGHARERDIVDTYRIEDAINHMRTELKDGNIRSVNEHEYDYAIGTIFSDMVGECEKLGDYVVNVVQARLGKQ